MGFFAISVFASLRVEFPSPFSCAKAFCVYCICIKSVYRKGEKIVLKPRIGSCCSITITIKH